MIRVTRFRQSLSVSLAILLVAFALLIGLYYSLRYGGFAMESDAGSQAIAALGTIRTGQLEHLNAYNNGFGYASQLTVFSLVSGLPVQTIQIFSSLWVYVVALVAFITYREYLGSAGVAALCVILLFLQPDFLFYIVRGAHEKYTWTFALLMLFFLARSYRYLHQPARLLLYVSLFYITFWAFISNNVYFATSFMGAIMLSLAGGWVLGRLSRKKTLEEQSRRTTLQRLIVISLACFTLVYIFINYTYQPALQFYYIFTSLADRVGLLVLSSQEAATPTSYQWFERAWRSQQAYLVLTGWQWLIALTSLVAWALGLIRLAKLEQKRWLLWLMYSAFGVLLVYGVLADYAGFMSTNLQLRMFTPFALFSSPLAADLVSRGIRALHARWRKLATTIAVAAITFGALALALKVTNDPALGNQWFFYTPTELAPARWINQHEVPQNEVWVDTWRHLPHVYYFWEGETPYVWDQYRWGKPQSEVRYTLISELVLLRANRSGISLPDTNDKNRVYDNGTAQLYHRRPLTPYQR